MKLITSQRLMLFCSCVASLGAFIGCAMATAADNDNSDSAFVYREIYLPESTGDNAKKLGLNNLDNDWALWGHNLKNILPEKKSESIYAKKNGATHRNQFCFMSDRLFEYISEYIDNNYDEEDVARFAILPNDNEIVCMCAKCVEEGNTAHNASPAVFNMINRLAERFPNKIFFTSYYRTTRGLPSKPLPENAGVLVSAMDYPLSPVETAAENEFIKILQAWKQKSNRIFVWDYINNFDDYFTPYPVFDIMQRRLKIYADNGVTAVFLNGSGSDFSSFSRLKAEVLAELTKNPDVDWKEVLMNKALLHYPVAGETIANFLIAQEDFVKSKGKELPLYEGVSKALDTYLPQEEFVSFHDELRRLLPKTEGVERTYVERLIGAMALTRLELNRMNGHLEGSRRLLADLKSLDSHNAPIYSESSWTVENYIRDYERMLDHAENNSKKNLLKGEKLMALTPLDQDYSDISILTDGMLGIPSNYHSGNLIMSPKSYSKIAIPEVEGLKKLRVCLSYNPAYRVALPQEVVLQSQGKEIARVEPAYPEDRSGHVMLDFKLPSSAKGSLVLTLYKNPEIHSMAVDEIEGFAN